MEASDLAAVFVDASDAPGSEDDLGQRLSALLRAARAEHPSIQLDGARFVRHVARLRPHGAPIEPWLEALRAGDLYLACACIEGVPAAIEALDRQLQAEAGAYLATLRPSPDFVDDVAQAVRERVLVGAEGSPPRIAEYSGRGALGAWLRVVTVRLALDVRRKRMEEHTSSPTVPSMINDTASSYQCSCPCGPGLRWCSPDAGCLPACM